MGDQLQLRDGGVDVVFGCETKETGEIYNQEADGILGLGNSEVSMVNQVSCSLDCRDRHCMPRCSGALLCCQMHFRFFTSQS